MKNIVINFKVVIPRELDKEKMHDPEWPADSRTKLVTDAAQAFAEFTISKRQYDKEHKWDYVPQDLKELTLDNGITVSWQVVDPDPAWNSLDDSIPEEGAEVVLNIAGVEYEAIYEGITAVNYNTPFAHTWYLTGADETIRNNKVQWRPTRIINKQTEES